MHENAGMGDEGPTSRAVLSGPAGDPFDLFVTTLFQQVARGEISVADAFERLHRPALIEFHRLLHSRCRQPEVAFNIQELWAEVMRKMFVDYINTPTRLTSGSPRGFIISVIRSAANTLWDSHNRYQRGRASWDDVREPTTLENNPEQLAAKAERNRKVQALIEDMHFEDREILRIAHTDWPRHLARELGISTKEFTDRLENAERRFRNAWKIRYGVER